MDFILECVMIFWKGAIGFSFLCFMLFIVSVFMGIIGLIINEIVYRKDV